MKTIKPIFRMVGSKYRMLKYLLPHFETADYFVDGFGGTGIVSANVLINNPKAEVICNDYDKLFWNTKGLVQAVLDNQVRYDGIGAITPAAIKQTDKKIDNGLMERIEKWRKEVLTNENITFLHYNFTTTLNMAFSEIKRTQPKHSILYLDPPYKAGIYKKMVKLETVVLWAHKALKYFNKVVVSYEKTDEVLKAFKNNWIIEEIITSNTCGRGKTRRPRTELIIWKEQS